MESLFSILLSEENVHGDEVCLRLTDDSEEETEETSAEETDNLKCLECVQSFLTSEELKNHKESKEHVLKLRRSRSRVVQQIRDSTLNRHQMIERSDSSERGCTSQQQLLEGLNDYNGTIETYHLATKKSFSDGYLSYIYSTIAYWAINLIFDPTVDDFSISLGANAWNPFGNVTFSIQYVALPEKPTTKIEYIIQFKHVVSNNAIMLNSFTDGIFNYEDFMRQILSIKGLDIDNQDTRFYVFTTATIAPNLRTQFEIKFCKTCKMAKVACKCKHDDEDAFEDVFINGESLTNSRNLLFNTSDDNGSVYRLFPFSRKGYKVPSLYVYTSQKPQREMVKSINENFGDFLEGVHPRFARNLIKFVECWYMKNTSKSFKFKMKKEDILIKLGDLLLNQYRVTPKIEKIEDHSTRFAIWVQALKCVDITVTQISNRKLSNLLEPFNLIIQNHLNKKIQIRSDCDDFEDNVTITSDYIRKMKDSALKFYISDEVGTDNSSNISLNNLYLIFWKAGLMPLTLNVDDKPSQKYVFQVINLLKTRGLIRRYLINTNDENIRLSAKSWKNLSFFINLGDIANKLDQNLMDSVKIKILNYNISLGKIRSTDPFFQNSIFPYEFFEMILSKYQLKIDTYHVGQKEVVDKLVLNHKLILDILQLIRNNDVNIVDDNVPIKMLRDINPNLFA